MGSGLWLCSLPYLAVGLWASVVFLVSLVWERVPSTWLSPQHSVFSSV